MCRAGGQAGADTLANLSAEETRWFRALDADGDGGITLGEVTRRLVRVRDKLQRESVNAIMERAKERVDWLPEVRPAGQSARVPGSCARRAAHASAAGGAGRAVPQDSIAYFDRDASGDISMQEWKFGSGHVWGREANTMAEYFDTLDEDGNGAVDLDELAAQYAPPEAIIPHIDTDDDGVLTADEIVDFFVQRTRSSYYEGFLRDAIASCDLDRNGKLGGPEFQLLVAVTRIVQEKIVNIEPPAEGKAYDYLYIFDENENQKIEPHEFQGASDEDWFLGAFGFETGAQQ